MKQFSSKIAGFIAFVILMCATANRLHAQVTVQNAVLFGTVSDSSGAVVPGATITVTSPDLQGSRTGTADGSGNYRIPDLPVGVYRVTYEMKGFETEIQNGVNLTAGFSARLDVALKPGSTTQTVEVSSAAPLIDTATPLVQSTIEGELLQNIPSTRQVADAVYLTAGVTPTATPDIGGSQLAGLFGAGAYGFGANNMTLADGVDIMQDQGAERAGPFVDGSLGQHPDYDATSAVQVISVGGQADIAEAGVITIMTSKSGSNEFHGAAHIFYEPHWFQLANLSASAPGGGSGANQLQYFYDAEGDLGGRIIKDKLWFFGDYHPQRFYAAEYGYLAPVAGELAEQVGSGQGYGLITQDDYSGQFTWQVTKKIQALLHYQFTEKLTPQYSGSPTAPYYDSTYSYNTNFDNRKAEVIWTPSSKWVFDFLAGMKSQIFHYLQSPGADVAGNPYTVDLTTGITTGARFNANSSDNGAHNRVVYTGSGSWYPNGKHSFQFGFQAFEPDWDKNNWHNHASGNYELETKNAGGVATGAVVPYELLAYNFPVAVAGLETALGGYGKDTWRATKKLTLDFGARFDHYHVYNNAESAPAGPFSVAASAPALTVGSWSDWVPRVGAAYDLTGSGKTVLRGSYGMYEIPYIGEFDLTAYNPLGKADNVYNWAGDTCQVTPSSVCTPSAAFISAIQASIANPSATTFNGKNIYVTTTSSALSQLNPKLRMPYLQQASVQIQHELRENLVVSGIYVTTREEDMYDLIYPNRPITDYTLPYQTVYPATDLVNGGKPLTIYTYPNAIAGGNYNVTEPVTRMTHPDFYNAISFSLTKRQVGKWAAGISLDFVHDHQYLSTSPIFAGTASGGGFSTTESSANPAAPYQEAFPLDTTWNYNLKTYLTYQLPYRVNVGLNYMLLEGAPAYTTDQVAVPASTINGVASASLGTITIPVNRFGSDRAPDQNLLNVKVAKAIHLPRESSLEVSVELFNALNVAPAETVNWLNGTGPTAFGYKSAFMPPFVGRIGARYTF